MALAYPRAFLMGTLNLGGAELEPIFLIRPLSLPLFSLALLLLSDEEEDM
jgi:hypothetical protein